MHLKFTYQSKELSGGREGTWGKREALQKFKDSRRMKLRKILCCSECNMVSLWGRNENQRHTYTKWWQTEEGGVYGPVLKLINSTKPCQKEKWSSTSPIWTQEIANSSWRAWIVVKALIFVLYFGVAMLLMSHLVLLIPGNIYFIQMGWIREAEYNHRVSTDIQQKTLKSLGP